MKKESGVYQITNRSNGWVYIGSSENIKTRWRSHRAALTSGRHINQRLQHDWNTFGPLAFEFSVLVHCEPSNLLILEQQFLDKLEPWDAFPRYNVARDAKAVMRGRKHSEATKNKLRGRTVSEETRQRMSAARVLSGHTVVGQKRTEEQRARYSAAAVARPHRPHSEETKRKIGAANRGNRGPLGQKRSEETCQKISEAKKAYWRNRREHGHK